jgi:hypothetical protein
MELPARLISVQIRIIQFKLRTLYFSAGIKTRLRARKPSSIPDRERHVSLLHGI